MNSIHSPNTLMAWLEGKPRYWGASIAHRSGLRMMPMLFTETFPIMKVDFSEIALTAFRSASLSAIHDRDGLSISSIRESTAPIASLNLAIEQIQTIDSQASLAMQCIAAATRAAYDANLRAGGRAGWQTLATGLNKAVISRNLEISESIDLISTKARERYWQMISLDCQFLSSHKSTKRYSASHELLARPLWSIDILKDIRHEHVEMRNVLHSLSAGFEIWVDWYDRRLAGRASGFALPDDPDVQAHEFLVQKDQGWWTRRPNDVNAEINEYINSITPDEIESKFDTLKVRMDLERQSILYSAGTITALDELIDLTSGLKSNIEAATRPGIGHNRPPENEGNNGDVDKAEHLLREIQDRLTTIENSTRAGNIDKEKLLDIAIWLHRIRDRVPQKTIDKFQEQIGSSAAIAIVSTLAIVIYKIPSLVLAIIRVLENLL